LAERHGQLALLKKTLPTYPTFLNWEVVVIRVGPVHPHDEEAKAAGWTHVERVPPSESWGTYGWTFVDERIARQRFAKACADYDQQMGEPDFSEGSDLEPDFGSDEPEF